MSILAMAYADRHIKGTCQRIRDEVVLELSMDEKTNVTGRIRQHTFQPKFFYVIRNIACRASTRYFSVALNRNDYRRGRSPLGHQFHGIAVVTPGVKSACKRPNMLNSPLP